VEAHVRNKVLWVPGTDHAGIATQNVVENSLQQRVSAGINSVATCSQSMYEMEGEYGGKIIHQLKRLVPHVTGKESGLPLMKDFQKLSERYLSDSMRKV
jgi:valyl-tRNA synthetase